MTQIEQVLKLMSKNINKKQLSMLENVLESVYLPSHVNIDNEEIVDKFLKRLKMNNYSSETIRQYSYILGRVIEDTSKHLLELSSEDIEDYLAKCSDNGVSAITLNNRIGCLRSLYKWLFAFEYVSKNPMDRVGRIKTERKLKDTISKTELNEIRDMVDTVRNRAIIEFLLGVE